MKFFPLSLLSLSIPLLAFSFPRPIFETMKVLPIYVFWFPMGVLGIFFCHVLFTVVSDFAGIASFWFNFNVYLCAVSLSLSLSLSFRSLLSLASSEIAGVSLGWLAQGFEQVTLITESRNSNVCVQCVGGFETKIEKKTNRVFSSFMNTLYSQFSTRTDRKRVAERAECSKTHYLFIYFFFFAQKIWFKVGNE